MKSKLGIMQIRSIYGCDWAERVRVIYAGDDESDEEALQALRGFSSCTFRVAPPSLMVPTAAHYRLADEDQLLPVLQVIERRLAQRSGLPAEENPSLADVLVTCIHSADEGEPVESKRRRRNSSSLYGAKSAFRFSVNQWAVRHESHNSADATTAVMGH